MAEGPDPSKKLSPESGRKPSDIERLLMEYETLAEKKADVIRQTLERYSDAQLNIVTLFYRQRVEEAIEEFVECVASALLKEKLLSTREHKRVGHLAKSQQRKEACQYLLDIVTSVIGRAQRTLWETLVKMQENKPKVIKILQEIQEKGIRLLGMAQCCGKTKPLSDRLKDTQHHHKEFLCSQNKTMSVNTIQEGEKTKTFLLSDHYTELIVTSSPRDQRLMEHELVARGRDHEEWQQRNVRKELEKIRPEELFGSSFVRSKSGITILSGIAGIGKTTMVQNIVYGWATGKIYPQFHFVFHFKFRDLNMIKGETSLKTMILESYPHLKDVLEEIWEKPEHLLFVFDGFDEFKERIEFTDSEINPDPELGCSEPESLCLVADIVRSLVQQEVLQGCSVLITSRPTALEALYHTNINLWAEISGFFAEGREDYIRRFFADEKIAAEVLSYVKENDILYTMCFNPSYCWILCSTLEPIFNHPDSKQPPPQTITQLYSNYIYNILKNHPRVSENPREVMLKAGEMAYEGVCNRTIVFNDDHFYHHQLEPSTFISGFMMEILEKDDHGRNVVYTFPHLTVQEFVAALAQYLPHVRRNMLELLHQVHTQDDGRFEIFLRFVVGLSSPHAARQLEEILGPLPDASVHEAIEWLMVNVASRINQSVGEGGKRNLLNMLYYLFESQNHRLAQVTVGAAEKLDFSHFTLRPLDCAVLSHVVQLCDTIGNLNLNNCTIQAEGIQRLMPALHKCRQIRLWGNNLGDSGVEHLSVALRNPECKIQNLGLASNNLTADCTEDLASALITNHSLMELNLSDNKLGDSGVKRLCVALRNPECKIQSLWLRCNSLTADCTEDLASTLNTNHSLLELNLNKNQLGDSGVKQLSEALRNPECKIQRLWLCDNSLTDGCTDDLVSALSTGRSLRFLSLVSNSFTDQSVPALRSFILTCSSLEEIRLWVNQFSSNGETQLTLLEGTRAGLRVSVWITD